MSSWTTANLEDCLDALLDYRGKSPKKSPTGIPVLSAKVVKTDGLLRPIEQTIATDYYSTWMVRGLPAVGDVVMTTEAPLGEVIQLNEETVSYALGQRIVCMRGKEGVLDSTFLRYALVSPQQQANLSASATGTTVLGISQKALRRIEISFPSIVEQRKIGALLSKIDDKIELNRRMNETLEEMARALFRDWFVDFGPTRRQIEGATDPTAIMGQAFPPEKAATLAPLFPAKLGEDVLPEGWINSSLGEHMEILDSKRVPLSSREREKRLGPYPYHGATSVMGFVDDFLFDDIILLVGEDGSVIKPNGKPFTQYVWGKVWVNNHAHVLKGTSFSTEQLKVLFDDVDIAPFTTGAVQLKLNQKNMKTVPMVLATPNVHAAYDEAILPMFAKIRANTEENQTLAKMRDLLLPKLMSGEIRLKDAGDK